jgi:hypothetical protein
MSWVPYVVISIHPDHRLRPMGQRQYRHVDRPRAFVAISHSSSPASPLDARLHVAATRGVPEGTKVGRTSPEVAG